MPDKDRETEYYSKDDKLEWRCKHCPTTYLLSGGTGNITGHLIEEHGLEQHSTRDTQVKNTQKSITDVFAESEKHPHKRRKLYERQSRESLDSGVLEIL